MLHTNSRLVIEVLISSHRYSVLKKVGILRQEVFMGQLSHEGFLMTAFVNCSVKEILI